MLRILDRYLIRQVIPPFLLALLVFTFLLELPPLSQMAEKLLAKGVPWQTVAKLLILLLPQALSITIPSAFLLGLLVAFGRLSADSEWIALQACGVSLPRLGRSVALLAGVAWVATTWMIIVALPYGNQTFREITYSIVAARAETEIKPRVFFEDFPRVVLYVGDVPTTTQGWTDVFVAETGEPGRPTVHLARRGRMVVDRARQTVDMVLEDGTSHVVTDDAQRRQQYKLNRFRTFMIRLDPTTVFPAGGPMKGENEMTIAELEARSAELRAQGQSDHNFVMALQNKYAIPVACLVFALIGMSIGFSSARSGKLGSYVLGVGVIFIYYVFMYGARAGAKGGQIAAWLAPWIPNIVLGIAGLLLFVRRARSAEGPLQFTLPVRRARAATTGAVNGGLRVVIRLPRIGLPRPRLLDRYVARIYGRLFTLSFASLLAIFYISTFLDLSDKLLKGKTTAATLLAYFWFRTPQFVYFVIPLSTLIAALVAVGLLTRNSELTVMKACGVSLYRIAAPLVACAMLAGGALFALEEEMLAPANRSAETLEQTIRTGSPRTIDVRNRRWIVSRDGNIYYYDYFDSRRRQLNGLTIYEFDRDNWRLARCVYSGEVRYAPTSGAVESERRRWLAREGWERGFPLEGDPTALATFRQRAFTLEAPEYFGSEQPDAERMSFTELRTYISQLRESGFDIVPFSVQLHRKLSFPFITIVMTLIAVPFAAATGRHGALYGIGAGIGLALVYWITGNVFGAVGSAGIIAPVLAAWAPNLIFGTCAGFLLLTVRT